MSKKSTDNLFELIQSLTKSEKRYFKLLSSRHTIGEENNYIILFDYIEKIEEYDEKLLFEHFKGQAFLNRFSITKKRLYDHILAALDTFYANSSLDAQLYKSLHSADILYNKSLYDQCRRVLKSAEKQALKNQRFAILLEISKRQKKLFETNGYSEFEQSDMDSINTNDSRSLDNLQQFSKLWRLKSELFIELSRHGVSRSNDHKNVFDSIQKELNSISKGKLLSIENEYLLNHSNSAYYYAVRDFEKCMNYLSKNISLLEENQNYLIEHPNSYFSILTNGIYVNEQLGNYSQANELLQKLKTFPQKYAIELSEDLQIKLFSSTSSIEISLYTVRGDFNAAIKLIPLFENGIRLYGDKISPQRKAFLEFKFAAALIGANDYNGALKWVNAILNDSKLEITEDIIAFTHLLDLIIHLELKHDQLLPYALKSTERFLKSRNILHNFEKVMLRFINKLVKSKDIFENESIWQELHQELSELKLDTHQNVGLEYFDFESWAKSKIKRIPFEEIIRLKFSENKFCA